MQSTMGLAVDQLDESLGDNVPTPFRPVQYLGSKLRALGDIAEAAHQMVGESAKIADLFSGSSIVSQSLASRGHQVSAVDTQEYAHVFASATLGVHRTSDECVPLALVNRTASDIRKRWTGWCSLGEAERALLANGDAGALRDFYKSLPNCWRNVDAKLFQRIVDGSKPTYDAPLITEVYAGTYFGIEQALDIDAYRHAVEHHCQMGDISRWQRQALLTALMSAMSSAVHSAGKHFAQHLLAGTSDNLSFLNRRLLDDRELAVWGLAAIAAAALDELPFLTGDGHQAYATRAEEFASTRAAEFDLFYLDPPYTAQQYSRFYHLLETVVSYEWPALLHGRDLTAGLYPRDRFKSDFSSKSKALTAFRSIARSACSQGTGLLISYSQSTAASNRNARMISFEDLLRACCDTFGEANVSFSRLGHRYRQFNKTARSNSLRDDPEILVQCKTH